MQSFVAPSIQGKNMSSLHEQMKRKPDIVNALLSDDSHLVLDDDEYALELREADEEEVAEAEEDAEAEADAVAHAEADTDVEMAGSNDDED